MKILLVDDEPLALKLLTRQLKDIGHDNVISCERGHAALALLNGPDDHPGLIFCDLQMPELDGIEFMRYLAGTGFKGNLVLISGEGERILQTALKLAMARRLNVIHALTKPVPTERLQQIMADMVTAVASSPRSARKTYGPEELRRAIADGELVNYYQPQVSLATGAVVGVETLVRWMHPQDGLVFPDQFIATAEMHGLIDDLTRAVLAGALRQAKLWLESGLTLNVSVNVSMDNLEDLGFPEYIAAAVAEAGIPPASLILEVTESRLMKDPLASLDILTRLRLRQIGLSIDDFGTGNSSLNQLRDIPFNELKLDQGFVHDACINSSLRVIVEASVSMARELGMKSVAEGVENEADWEFLRQTSSDIAQGYFIAKPMPAEDIGQWIDAWEERRPGLVRAGT